MSTGLGRHERLILVMVAVARVSLTARLSWGLYGSERLFDAIPAAFAQNGDLDCADYTGQAEARTTYDFDPSDPNDDGEAFDCGSDPGQYQNDGSDRGGLSQVRYGGGSDALIESGSPKVGPAPNLQGGGCSSYYPMDRNGACWR